jgi:hypothetical protein
VYIPTYQPFICDILLYNLTYLPTDLLFSTYYHTTLLTYLPSYILTYFLLSTYHPKTSPTSYFQLTIIKPYLLPSTSHLHPYTPTYLLLPTCHPRSLPTYLNGLQATYLSIPLPTKHHAACLLIT